MEQVSSDYGKYQNTSVEVGLRDALAKAEPRAIERSVNEAACIRDQLAEAVKLSDSILERVAGPRPECSGDENCKEAFPDGSLGELARVQASTINYLAELRRTLSQIGKYV